MITETEEKLHKRCEQLENELAELDLNLKNIAMLYRRYKYGRISPDFFFKHLERYIEGQGNPLRGEPTVEAGE